MGTRTRLHTRSLSHECVPATCEDGAQVLVMCKSQLLCLTVCWPNICHAHSTPKVAKKVHKNKQQESCAAGRGDATVPFLCNEAVTVY